MLVTSKLTNKPFIIFNNIAGLIIQIMSAALIVTHQEATLG